MVKVTTFDEGFATRYDDLKKLWELYKPHMDLSDQRCVKIHNYLTEIPLRLQRQERYEALFDLTRIATLLGELRVQHQRKAPIIDGNHEGNTEECTAEETPSNIHAIRDGAP